MNFRTCKYFLTVCEMGTINAAARRLYISQQSLSQHMRKLEEEVGLQLFHRDNPLVLTEAGTCVRRMAQTVLDALRQMDMDLAVCRGNKIPELNLGLLDYGTPDFLASLLNLFLQKQPNTLVRMREIEPGGTLPADIPLFISPQELGSGFKSEPMYYDRLVVCVKSSLLKKSTAMPGRTTSAGCGRGTSPRWRAVRFCATRGLHCRHCRIRLLKPTTLRRSMCLWRVERKL